MSPLVYQRGGSALFNSYASNAAAQQRRLSRETLQCMMERLWTPLIKHAGNPELAQRQFLRTQSSMSGFAFTCQLNGHVGDAALLRAFTSTMLKGFDVVNVTIDAENARAEPCSFQGSFTLAHTRPLVDWQPLATLTEASANNGLVPRLFTLPFSSHIEAMFTAPTPAMTHLCVRSPFLDAIAAELQQSGDHCPQLCACLGLSNPRERFLSLHRLAGRNI